MTSTALQRVIQAATELLAPQQLANLETVRAEADAALARLRGVNVTSTELAHQVQAGLVEVKRLLKTIKEDRAAQLAPLAREEKALRTLWGYIEDPLLQIAAEADRKVLAWMQAEDERLARKASEARREQEAAAARQREAEERLAAASAPAQVATAKAEIARAETDLALARVAEPVEARVQAIKGAGGGTSFRRPGPWRYKVLEGGDKLPDWLALGQAVLENLLGELSEKEAARVAPSITALQGAIAMSERCVPPRYWSLDDKAIKAAIAGGARTIPGLAIWQEETLATRT